MNNTIILRKVLKNLGRRQLTVLILSFLLTGAAILLIGYSFYRSTKAELELRGEMDVIQSAERFNAYLSYDRNALIVAGYKVNSLLMKNAPTEEILREWLFVKKKAEVIFALDGEKEVGFALFFHNFSTFLGRAGIYLEDLYVRPSYRGKGYGKALLIKLAQIAVTRGCGRLEWACLDWNTPSIDFYKSLGAVPMDEWTVYRVSGQTLEEMAGRRASGQTLEEMAGTASAGAKAMPEQE